MLHLVVYVFSPISAIHRVISKVKQVSADSIIVAPFWPTQVWYSVMLKMFNAINSNFVKF